jgi:hypothetical protein
MDKAFLLQKFKERKNRDLFLSIAIDALGMASYFVPILGEGADIIIGPITGALIYAVHKSGKGAIMGTVEEIIPFTDVIPTASIIWVMRYITNQTETFKNFALDSITNERDIDEFLQDLEG